MTLILPLVADKTTRLLLLLEPFSAYFPSFDFKPFCFHDLVICDCVYFCL